MIPIKRISLLITCIFLLTVAFAQVSVVNYMKLTGTSDDYVAMEEKWAKIHKARVAAGQMEGWQLLQNIFASEESPFHYVTVNTFKNLEQFENAGAQLTDIAGEVYSPDEWEALVESTTNLRLNVKNDVLWVLDLAKSEKPTEYVMVNFFNVPEGDAQEYVDMEARYYKPFAEKQMEKYNRSRWALYQVYPREHDDYHFITIDGYAGIPQDFDFGELWDEVHPDTDRNETWQQLTSIRSTKQLLMLKVILSAESGE